jgi:hypothetical protein
MTYALDRSTTVSRSLSLTAGMTSLVRIAGVASLGAGAIHAAAIGVHSEHRSAVITFTAVAALQLGWGAVALVRDHRLVALVGGLINLGALGGWALAKTSGITAIAGLDEAESIQTADGLAAALALATVVLLALGAWSARGDRRGVHAPLPLLAVAVSVLTVFGMVSAGSHAHAAGGHGGDGTPLAAGDDHHDDGDDHHGDAADGADATAVSADDHGEEDGAHAMPAPVPYDPTKPIDLGGVDGVTLEQQAAAENIIAVTLHGLPQWSDPAVAEAAGFRSIGDGGTGVEHFVHRGHMTDDVMFDPDVPESLVYDTTDGGRRLVAAMYMAKEGTPLEDVPNIGGPLMQWHTHDNLCYNAEGKVRGITDAEGNCPPGLVKPVETPMIHVWIEPHPCGPFAALEGIGGGRIPDGEAKLCDVAHGSH